MAKKSQNTAHAEKRKAPPTAWKKGQSGNPGGRPKNNRSITHWINEFGNMTPAEAARLCKVYAAELKKGGNGLPIFGLIAVRALMELMNDPSTSVLGHVLDRTEGKVSQLVELRDWRAEARDAGLDPDAMAADLFAKVPLAHREPE